MGKELRQAWGTHGMDGWMWQIGNGTACQPMSSHHHPSKYSGNGKILLLEPRCCPWAALSKEYIGYAIFVVAYNKITWGLSAWLWGCMEATPHRQNITQTDFSCECCDGTDWFRWNIEINLHIRIDHSRRFHHWKSKPWYHFFIHRVFTVSCQLDQDNSRDVSRLLWSIWFDTKAKQQVCVKATERNGIHQYM